MLLAAAHRWVSMPHEMHSNFVARILLPRLRSLKPAGSLSTLRAPLDGKIGWSSSDTSAAPVVPQRGHLRATVQLSRVAMSLLWRDDCGIVRAVDQERIRNRPYYPSTWAANTLTVNEVWSCRRDEGKRNA
jgi:hypothetical protein